MEIVGIYLFCCDQSEVPEVDQRCVDIKDQNENSASYLKLAKNLIEIHYNILENVKDKLASSIEHLIKAPDENTLHWWFCFFKSTIYVRPEGNQGNTRS